MSIDGAKIPAMRCDSEWKAQASLPVQAGSFSRMTLLAGLASCLLSAGVLAQTSTFGSQQQAPDDYLDKIVPYVPTPVEIVQRMLETAKVGPDDLVYDLGSGDGRIVIMAAQKFGAHAVGVELDPDLYKQSFDHVKELGLEEKVTIVHENMFRVNVRRATVVTLYLLTSVNERLRPQLEKQLRSGARVVSHDFMMPGWEAEKNEEVVSKNGVSHKIYLYIRP
jgi:SAM-dependent methyltransferase